MDGLDLGVGQQPHPLGLQGLGRLGRNPFRETAQDAGRGLHNGDVDVEPLVRRQARRQFVMAFDQFGGQLHPRGAGPDDGDAQPAIIRIGRSQEGAGQTFVESLGVGDVFQKMGVFGGARRVEQVRTAADRQDQGVEGQGARGDQHGAVLIADFAQGQGLVRRIEAGQVAEGEAEMVAARQDRIGQALLMAVQRPRRHLVQAGLPQVEDGAVDQQDAPASLARTEPTTEAGGQLKPAGAAADDDDVVLHQRRST